MREMPHDPAGNDGDGDGDVAGVVGRRADDIDRAVTPRERRRAWARFVPTVVAGLVEAYLRDTIAIGAATLSVLVLVVGALSGDGWWIVVNVVAGLGGAVLVLTARSRRWPIPQQWLAIIAVLVVSLTLITTQVA